VNRGRTCDLVAIFCEEQAQPQKLLQSEAFMKHRGTLDWVGSSKLTLLSHVFVGYEGAQMQAACLKAPPLSLGVDSCRVVFCLPPSFEGRVESSVVVRRGHSSRTTCLRPDGSPPLF